MAINKQIKGSNLCEMSCIEKKNVIHPETCVNQVLIDDSSEKTLREWILNAAEPATLGTYRCLKEWLSTNYPVSGGSQDIPHADSTHYGVIMTGEDNPYLTLNDGVLTFNYSQLPQLRNATFTTLGGVKLGNNGTVSGTFTHEEDYSDITYPTGLFSNFYGFPLSLDANNRAGVVIPQELFSGRVQSDWNTSNNTDPSYIRNKPNLATVATTGNYNDLINKPTIPAAQIQSDWNQTNTTALDYIKNKPAINVFTGATPSLAGTSGLVPAPSIDDRNKVLCGDGNWVSVDGISVFDNVNNGLVPKPGNNNRNTFKVLKANGEWDKLISIYDIPVEFVTELLLNTVIQYFTDLFEEEITTIGYSGGMKELKINIIGPLRVVSGESHPRIIEILSVFSDILRQTYESREYFLNLKTSFTFAHTDSDNTLDIPLIYLSGTYYSHEIFGENINYNAGDTSLTIRMPQNTRNILTYEYSISNASANPNVTSKMYNTKIYLSQDPLSFIESHIAS